MKRLAKVVAAGLLFLTAGCATYMTPGEGVAVEALSAEGDHLEEARSARPAANFPARIALARLQAAGYYGASMRNNCYGSGKFCVVTQRDFETDEAYERFTRMPQVGGVAVMNRLLLPQHVGSVRDLRRVAGMLRADLLLVYSMDTGFRIENTDVGPLQLVSLGFLPTKKARVTSTASAVLLDVRSGFIYGLAEATATEEQRGTFWSSKEAVENARQRAEADAFQKLIGEVEKFWREVVKTHAGDRAAAPAG